MPKLHNIAQSLLFVAIIMALPWQIAEVCYKSYQESHEPPDHVKGLCKIRKSFKGIALWPPMDCQKINFDIGDFQKTDKLSIADVINSRPAFRIEYESVISRACNKPDANANPPPGWVNPFITSVNYRGPPLT